MTTSLRERLRKILRRRYGDEKARQVAYRMLPAKAGLLAQRMKASGKD
jgi:hypothetical protein